MEIENDEADVKLVVNGSEINVLNTTFYRPGEVLSVDCVSLSIPKADVFIETENEENGNFEVIDQSQMTELLGTYENGYRWNTTFSRNTKIRCSSTKNGKVIFFNFNRKYLSFRAKLLEKIYYFPMGSLKLCTGTRSMITLPYSQKLTSCTKGMMFFCVALYRIHLDGKFSCLVHLLGGL